LVCLSLTDNRRTNASLEAELRAAMNRLPGAEAHLRMSPNPRMPWDPSRFPDGGRDAAALLLLYPHADEWHLLLTVRGPDLRHHTGQISLPGGRVDDGESIEAAALREAEEEVGVGPAAVRVIGQLTPVQIPISGFVLHPVIGIADARPEFRPDDWEVARLIEVPLQALRDTSIVQTARRTREVDGRVDEIDVPYFAVQGEQVWGATAMVLAELLAVLESMPDISISEM
jgi:8-oxo-dGTP pyrophosphatase MutT (NUDIX family)